MLGAIILVIVIVLIVGALPHWGYWGPNPSPYGYYPSGLLGVVLLIVILLLIFGRL